MPRFIRVDCGKKMLSGITHEGVERTTPIVLMEHAKGQLILQGS